LITSIDYSPPPVSWLYIAISEPVCLSVCLSVRSHVPKITRANFTQFSVHVTCGRGSKPVWRQCNTLGISGFVDDVIFDVMMVLTQSLGGNGYRRPTRHPLPERYGLACSWRQTID